MMIVIMTGCAPTYNTEEEVVQETTEETEEEQRFIVPSNSLSSDLYQTILPFQPSAARGVISRQVANRNDIDELEEGLTRLATQVFDPEEYLFQEGQHLTSSMVDRWIDEFNPPKPTDIEGELRDADEEGEDEVVEELEEELEEYQSENPRVLSHILEQNFLIREDENRVELGGVAIGLALKSEYTFSVNYGPTQEEAIDEDVMYEEGQEVANSLLEKLRNIEDLQDVPILIALYRENDRNAIIPGNYVAMTVSEPNDMLIDSWESINEEYVLFPSNYAEETYYEDTEMMTQFRRDVAEYFPNYIGVIGQGFYEDEELRELSINIQIEFQGKQEIIGFTQHVSGLMMEHFPPFFDLEVTVESPSQQESLLFRKSGEEEITHHIYQ